MHANCALFMEDVAKRFSAHFHDVKVLEVGSNEPQGTTRGFFHNCEYLGVDRIAGPNVDLVSDINSCDFAEGSFDTVIVNSVFEHDAEWRTTLSNCIKWLKERGICIVCFVRNKQTTGLRTSLLVVRRA